MATLGKTTNGTFTTSASADGIYLSSAIATVTETLDSGSIRVSLSSAGSSLAKLVVYSNLSFVPTNLLAESDEVTITNTTEQEIAFTFSGLNRITITDGVRYYFGIFFQDPGTPDMVMSRGNSLVGVFSMSTPYPTAPSVFSGTSNFGGPYDCYLTTVPLEDNSNFLAFM